MIRFCGLAELEEAEVVEAAAEAVEEVGREEAAVMSLPDFSILCSFFNKFGSFLGLRPQSFSRLEEALSFDAEGRGECELPFPFLLSVH